MLDGVDRCASDCCVRRLIAQVRGVQGPAVSQVQERGLQGRHPRSTAAFSYFQRAVKDAIRQHTPADAVDTSEDGSESDDVDAPVPPRDPLPKRACAKAAPRPVPEPSSAGESSDSDESSVAPPLSHRPAPLTDRHLRCCLCF